MVDVRGRCGGVCSLRGFGSLVGPLDAAINVAVRMVVLVVSGRPVGRGSPNVDRSVRRGRGVSASRGVGVWGRVVGALDR